MASMYQNGKYLDYTPSSDVAAGDFVFIGAVAGVADRAITANELGAITIEGVYEEAKSTSEAITVGAALYWDSSEAILTATAEGNTYVGKAAYAAAEADETVKVLLNAPMLDTNTTYTAATSAEVTTGTNETKFIPPKSLKDAGIVALSKATGAEVTTGTDDAKFVTAKALADASIVTVPDATTSVKGKVKMAANVALAAGEAPTKAEFDAVITALIASGAMAAGS